jgi:predicted glycosyltransferase
LPPYIISSFKTICRTRRIPFKPRVGLFKIIDIQIIDGSTEPEGFFQTQRRVWFIKQATPTVGGSGVGYHLLKKIITSYPEVRRQIPELRMLVVTGPRIDPASLPAVPGLEIRGYVDGLYRHLAACDIAVVQGGLSTGMELIANRRPFLYFPLKHHFEQNFHVRYRFNRYGGGCYMNYDEATSETIALALVRELNKPVNNRSVESDGAARAARKIAELL